MSITNACTLYTSNYEKCLIILTMCKEDITELYFSHFNKTHEIYFTFSLKKRKSFTVLIKRTYSYSFPVYPSGQIHVPLTGSHVAP